MRCRIWKEGEVVLLTTHKKGQKSPRKSANGQNRVGLVTSPEREKNTSDYVARKNFFSRPIPSFSSLEMLRGEKKKVGQSFSGA